MNENWNRWRGEVQTRLDSHAKRLDDHCNDIDAMKQKINDVTVKLAVPLFLTSLVGTGIGAIIVWLVTHGLKAN